MEEDRGLAPEKNLEPNSAGLKSSRTGGVWHKPLEESHSAQIKERSLLGHLVCSVETKKEIGALYKVSPSKFVLVFGSKTAKEKLQGTEIQCCFDNSEICLNFSKQIGPLRNGREPIFVTILLPEFISDQAVRLTFSNIGEVISAFKERHEFNRKIPNGKTQVKIILAGVDPAILPRKIYFHSRFERDVLFAEKMVLCYRYKTQYMLCKNCPVATPTIEDSGMSFNEQSDTPGENLAPAHPESSVEY